MAEGILPTFPVNRRPLIEEDDKREDYIEEDDSYGTRFEPSQRVETFQIVAAIAASFGGFALGTVIAWSSPALPSLDKTQDIVLSSNEKTWVASVMALGALLSAPFAGKSIDKFGRKMTMINITVLFALGWVIITAAKNFPMLMVGRFITGFGGGTYSLCSNVYIAEVVEVRIRGQMGSFFQLMVTGGVFFTFVLGYFLTWKWLSAVLTGVPAIFLIVFVWMPETPAYLVSAGRSNEALSSLVQLRGPRFNVNAELQLIEKRQEEAMREKATIRDLMTPVNARLLLVSLSLMFFQQFSGVNAVLFYTVRIFRAAGSALDENVESIIVGAVQFIATGVSTVLIDRCGRKLLLLVSDVFMAMSLIALGIFFYFQSKGYDVASITWLPLVSLAIFIIMFSIGFGPIPWIMMGELFPLKIVGKATTIATLSNWLQAFIVTKTFESMVGGLHEFGTFWFFGGICLLGSAFVFLCIRETKGKTIEEIMEVYSPSSS